MLGSWNVDVIVDAMPEKVATAVAKLNEDLMGAEYTPIAYLGSQVVNGTNHAVLAEQTIITGKDTKNIVLIIFNEKGMDCTLVNIERVLESGAGAGGIEINVKTEISKEAQLAIDEVLAGFVGSNIDPFALLGTQVVRGINYFFAAEVTPVVPNPDKTVALVTINGMDKSVSFTDILK